MALAACVAGAAYAQVPTVAYYPAEEVRASFAKGAVLYDGAGGANYMVHTSRRDSAGQAEVHERDTDVIYVIDGTATFVTGGTAVGLRTTGPGERRGSGIDGGDVRTIAKGDVIIVPHGTPHWFKEVPAPLMYYVVKVR